jgi:hypothetical protein
MMVAATARGRNIGAVLLDIAECIAVAQWLPSLRLDAWRTNRMLHAYYIRQGLPSSELFTFPIVDLARSSNGHVELLDVRRFSRRTARSVSSGPDGAASRRACNQT